ncbi:MAG: TonB-dependent receptor [Deltaproteobacteria bacterium]|nr:TonB-dependent receptor [Deltaproteobacteria bacterium]
MAVFLQCFNLYAEEPAEEVTRLEEVVVTATKVEEPKRDVSAPIQVITEEDIINSTAKNAGEIISEAGLGNYRISSFTKGGGTSGGVAQIRGFSTNPSGRVINNSVSVLVDGRLSPTTDLSQFPIDIIERIEIVKGPASVLYGSSAMGGVINIITKKKGEKGIHGSILGEGGSWDYWKTGGGLNGSKGSFDFYLTASRSAQGEYEAKDYGKIDNTGYDEVEVATRLGYRLFDNHYISIGYRYGREWDIGRPGPRYSPDPDDYAHIERNDFDIGYNTETFKSNYYYSINRDSSHASKKSGPGTEIEYFQQRETQGIGIQKTFSLRDHRLVTGGQWDRIDFEAWRAPEGTPYEPSNRYDNYAAFGELRLSLLDKRLLLNAGLRYDYFEEEMLPTRNMAITPRKEEFDNLTKRVGFVYKITDDFSIKGNIGEGYRAPSPLELASDYVDLKTGARRLGNPELDAEKSITYDTGIEVLKGSFKGGLTFFHTDYTDKITSYYNSALGATTYKNAEGATIQGVEANLSYDIGFASGLIEPFANITYYTRYSVEDETVIASYGKTMLDTPKWAGSFGVKLLQEKWDARLIAKYMGDKKVTDPAPPSNGKVVVEKGDFTVLDLKGSYRPIKNLELSASVENLFDRAYEYALYYPMPGRTFWVAVKWVF